MSIVTLVGNPRDGSRTLAVAVRAAEALARRLGPGPVANGGSPPNGPAAGSATSPGAELNVPAALAGLLGTELVVTEPVGMERFDPVPVGAELIDTVDLAGLAPHLFAPEPSPGVEVALELVRDADVLVVASPTYKGTYTGLLKAFLDKLPHQALAGKAALPLLVMGDAKHALAVEVHLRPLLVELGAFVPTPGLAILESQIPDLDDVLEKWAGVVARQLSFRQEVPA
ncbi:NAD(P)H-dependent oxidoreductase [Planotetraspora sp. A-T 1434]|uniref:NADPH-dependent FMN reductase n=1 Tax=Planotetraspora sp. A-T 1434 TaxID=2979219 RepID=UPI0021C03CD5|nr:NAD(P)H-dependent oxidoreductase [Planotetraspora sp. A-T 1434]MCT9931296.1 NAD(P)H-dependent oxidoreductase [Planotetraspora sp. A-T 1434]